MVKNLKVYVFDMGKVIIKSSRMNDFYKLADMKCEYKDLKKAFYSSEQSDAVYRGLISDDEFFDFIKKMSGSEKSIAELERLYIETKGDVFPDTIRIIRELSERGCAVHLLSNLKKIDYQYLASVVDLDLFTQLFLSYQIGKSKPHDDVFEHVIEILGTSDFVFFDDAEENISTAKKHGIKAYQTTGDDILKCYRLIR